MTQQQCYTRLYKYKYSIMSSSVSAGIKIQKQTVVKRKVSNETQRFVQSDESESGSDQTPRRRRSRRTNREKTSGQTMVY